MAVSLMGPATGLTNSKLAMADTTAGRVVKGDTFYAGDKNIKTGTMPNRALSPRAGGQADTYLNDQFKNVGVSTDPTASYWLCKNGDGVKRFCIRPPYGAYALGTVDASGHVSATTAVAKSDITALGIPSTNTTYSAATQSANGLMSAADKKKLDGFGAASSYATMTYVGQQISAAGHISKSIVETLPAVKDAKDNIIYMIKKATPDGSNLYDEYMLISGALEKIGDTKTVIDEITNEEIDAILAS